MARNIKDIIEDMRKETINDDYEVAHCNADSLLIEAFELISNRSKYKKASKKLVELYDDVGKWYA